VSRTHYITVSGACQEGFWAQARSLTGSRKDPNGKSRRLSSCALCVIIDRSKLLCSRAAEMEWLADANGAAEEGKL